MQVQMINENGIPHAYEVEATLAEGEDGVYDFELFPLFSPWLPPSFFCKIH